MCSFAISACNSTNSEACFVKDRAGKEIVDSTGTPPMSANLVQLYFKTKLWESLSKPLFPPGK